MAGRSGRRRVDPSSPLVDLDAVFADDAFIDAIAAQSWGADPHPLADSSAGRSIGSPSGAVLTVTPPTMRPRSVDPLTEIFQSWRQELAVEPLPAPPKSVRTHGPAQQRRPPSRNRALRPALAIAAAIAALLVGSASIASKDAPRDSPLFALTQALWPSRAASVASADQVGAILVEARFALDDGRPQDAQLALLRAAAELGRVDDVDGKSDMQQQVAALWVQAAPQETRDTRGQDDSPTTTRGPRPSAGQGSSTPDAPSAQAAVAEQAAIAALAGGVAQAAGAAQAAAAAVPGGSQNAAQVLAPAQAPPTDVLQAALGAGWPSSTDVAPSTAGPVVSSVDTPTTDAAAISSAGDPSSPAETVAVVPSVPSTPPEPTAPAEVPASDPPVATEQSPPSPTPSGPTQSVDTVPPDGAGPPSADTAAVNSAANAPADSKVASIPLDPAVAGTG